MYWDFGGEWRFRFQRQRANMERKRQPTLPIDDALLHSLPPMECGVILRAGSSDEEERPRVVAKKLTITSAMAGPILRVWDFLHTTSQVRILFVCYMSVIDFASTVCTHRKNSLVEMRGPRITTRIIKSTRKASVENEMRNGKNRLEVVGSRCIFYRTLCCHVFPSAGVLVLDGVSI